MRRPLLVLGAVAVFVLGAVVGAFVLRPADGDQEDRSATPSAADIGFSQDMVVHHDQALEMSRAVRGRVGGRVEALAESILEVQNREVGVMRGWLDLWGAPQVSESEPMAWMDGAHGDHGEDHGGHDAAASSGDEPPMPGMASRADLASLDTLSGEALEVRFLQLMFAHHEGGIEMAEHGRRMAALDAVSALARSMSLEQEQEQTLMLQLLAERDAEPRA